MIKAFLKFRKRLGKTLKFYPSSLAKKGNQIFFLIRGNGEKKFIILGKRILVHDAEESGELKFRGPPLYHQICPDYARFLKEDSGKQTSDEHES